MGEFPQNLVAMQPHVYDSWAITYTNNRYNWYNFTGTPSIAIDGTWRVSGTYGSCSADASAYRDAINTRLADTHGSSSVDIDVDFTYDASTVTISATFELLDAVTLTDPRANLVLTENNISYGSTTYQHVVRAGYGEQISLQNPGDMVTVEQTFSRGSWNMANCDAIAFLQRVSGSASQQEIYQAMSTAIVIDFHYDPGCAIASAPNGNGDIDFAGTLTNTSDMTDELTVSLDNTFSWPAAFKLDGEAEFHTEPSLITLGPDEEIGVTLRVSTDAEVRTGTGALEITSTNSTRTADYAYTAYNGSPAVLLVGDDNYRPDEVPLVDGLTEAGLLFEHWDCFLDHGNKGPTAAQMLCWDVVIWHHGYEQNNLLTTDEIEAIMDYMDAGRGFILSSQDLLSQTSPPLPAVFLSDYLGIANYTTNVDADHATGIAGDPIGDSIDTDLVYQYSHYDRADEIEPNAFGTTFLLSEDAEEISLRSDNGVARSVFFSFCFNGLDEEGADPNNPATLLARAIDWVTPLGGQSVPDEFVRRQSSTIGSVAPNPFTPWSDGRGTAAIRLRISEQAAQSPARLDVVDLTGRRVANLLDRTLPAGVVTTRWDGRDAQGQIVANGVYYLRLVTGDGTHSARTVVMR